MSDLPRIVHGAIYEHERRVFAMLVGNMLDEAGASR